MSARDSDVVEDLLTSGQGMVKLTEDRAIDAADLASIARGEDFRFQGEAPSQFGMTEQRLAKSLNISDALLLKTSLRLWQRSFNEERDRRAGPEANQQKKGRISRELRAELEETLADGDD